MSLAFADLKLPKISATTCDSVDEKSIEMDSGLLELSGRYINQVPHINYLSYRAQHNKKRSNSSRQESSSPVTNYFYQPQIIRVSPRSHVKVYSCFPIPSETVTPKKIRSSRYQKNNTQKFNASPRVFPAIHAKFSNPTKGINPALTFGEKLWKLYELASLNKNEVKSL